MTIRFKQLLVVKAKSDPEFLALLQARLESAILEVLDGKGAQQISGSIGDISFGNATSSLTLASFAAMLNDVIREAQGLPPVSAKTFQLSFRTRRR